MRDLPPHALAAGDQLLTGAGDLSVSESLGFVLSTISNLSDAMMHVLDEHENEGSELVMGLICASGLTMTLAAVALEKIADETNVVPCKPPDSFIKLVTEAIDRAQS